MISPLVLSPNPGSSRLPKVQVAVEESGESDVGLAEAEEGYDEAGYDYEGEEGEYCGEEGCGDNNEAEGDEGCEGYGEPIELAPNQLILTISLSLLNQVRQVARAEGVSAQDFIHELIAEGVTRRAFEDANRPAPSHLMTRTGYVPPEADGYQAPRMTHHYGQGGNQQGNFRNGNQQQGGQHRRHNKGGHGNFNGNQQGNRFNRNQKNRFNNNGNNNGNSNGNNNNGNRGPK
jgi:hypothetical protein